MINIKTSLFVVLLSFSLLYVNKAFSQVPAPCYASGINYGSGGFSTNHMATDDFNNDGKADLLITNFGNNNISLLLGSGTGTFGAPTNFNSGAGPIDVLTGDFNNDGNKDAATTNSNGNNVSIFLGNGLGSFATAVNYAVGGSPYGITTSDANGDGNLDIAVANSGANNVSILMGSASGTFAAAVNYATGTSPLGLTFSDLNNDGNPDLAVCNGGGTNFSVLMGSSTGTFASAVNYSLGTSPRSICAFDFNSDGNKDLAMVSTSSNGLEVLLGSSSGTFALSTIYATSSAPFDIITGDFNNDGFPDLAIPCQSSNFLSIWTSSGTGTFALASNYLTGSLPRGVCSADFNSDGEADLATANNGSNNSTVFLSCAPGAALNLNGSPYITKTSIPFGTTWTAEAWIRPTNVSGTFWKTVLGQMFWNNNQGFVIRIYNNLVGLEAPGGVFIDAPITANVWTHVAAVYENGIYRFYKDGLLVGARVASFSSSSNPFYIGVRANNNNVGLVDAYIGDMDEVRIWNTARTGCQIQTFMNCEIPTIATGLIANHHFNQGYGSSGNPLVTQLKDASASASNGTLVGFTLSGGTNNWIAAGAMANSYSISAPPTATIGVTGNGNTITNNSASTSTLNFTDFGTSLTTTFVVTNTTAGTLNVGTPIFTGGNASEFTVTVLPAATLAASGTTSFVVTCSPTSTGVKTTSVNIFNNDCVLPQFRFAIQYTATPGEKLTLDGSNDYITGLPAFNLTNEFTVEFWAKRNSNTTQDFIVSQGITNTDQGLHIGFYGPGSTFNFGFFGDDLPLTSTDLNWHHWACVYKSSGVGKNRFLYMDGVLVASDLSTGPYSGTGSISIGATVWNPAFDIFDGDLDELRIWNLARTQCEVQSYMNCEIPSTSTGLLANFHFNQGIAGANNSTVTTLINATGGGNGTMNSFGLSGANSNWTAPGAVVSNSTTPFVPSATLAITGNGNPILHGSTSTSTLNGTNLGTNTVQTYVIQNTGGGTLTIPNVYFTGATGGQFTVTALTGSLLGSAATASLSIAFTSSAVGTASAVLNIMSSDCTSPTFSFVVNATTNPASAFALDGTNDYIQFTDPNLGTSDFTIETWFKPNNNNSSYLITTRSGEPGPGGNWWALGCNSTVFFEMAASVGNYSAFSTPTNIIAPGNWYHAAVVRSNSVVSIYLNGVLQGQVTETVTRNFVTGNNSLRFGGWPNFNAAWFNGQMDESRIWNVARTQCQIQQFMNCEIPTTATGLLANYHFNQGLPSGNNTASTSVIDAVGSFNGNLVNTTRTGATSNWVSPGGVVNGFTTSTLPTATISVFGNGNSIPMGTTTSTNNFTDFGTNTTRTLVIQNSGVSALNVGAITFSGSTGGQFTVSTLPSTNIVSAGTSSFVILFTPTVVGTASTIVRISSNDCTNPTYSFVITATTSPASALNFDGVNDFVSVAHTSSLNAYPITVETWFKSAYTGSVAAALVNKYISNSLNGWQIYLKNGFLEGFYFKDASNHIAFPISATPFVADNNWHHVAMVVDANGGRLYVDGILSSPFNGWIGTPGPPSTSTGMNLGAYDAMFSGSLDEVRVWNSARTQCEIQQFMNCEIAAPSTGLMANYHFNQGLNGGNNSGVTTLFDATGANNGSLLSFALTGSGSNWTSPSIIANNFTTNVAPAAIFSVTGNGNNVPQGSTTTTLNGTSFGTLTAQTFSAYNAGTGTLQINTIYFTGPNASQFSVTSAPVSTLTTVGSTFAITLSPTVTGVHSATVNVITNDCTNPTFTFVITSTVNPAGALNLDGSNDYVGLGMGITNSLSTLNKITAEAWVYPTNTTSNGVIVGNYGSPLNLLQFQLRRDGTGYTFFIGNGNGFLYNGILAANTVTLNTWQHVAGVWDGLNMSLYINGQLKSTGTATYTSFGVASNSVVIGTNTWPEPFAGSIDEVRIWSTDRSQCQIQQFMSAEIPTTATNLMANYHFNQGIPSGTNTAVVTLIDAAGANTGTLNSFALTGPTSNWILPGAVANGFTTATAPTATMSVSGNGNTIASGATSTSTLNLTSFGSATSRTFVIANTGLSTLNLANPIISGTNAAEFTVTSISSLNIPAAGSASLVIAFTPTAGGLRTALVGISSNDCNNPNYTFVIDGTPPPAAAFYFDGVNDYAQGPIFSTATNSVTIQAKVLVTGYHGFHQFITLNGSSAMYGLMMTAGGQLASYNSAFGINTSSYTIPTNTWVSVAVVYKDNVGMLYANGVQTGSFTYASLGTPTGSFLISANGFYGENFKGAIDEVQFWNRPLSQCEILSNLNSEIPTSATGLLANYHFNQGSANLANPTTTTIIDASGNNNHLFIGNTAALSGTISNWISPGAVVSGFTTVSTPSCEINIMANGNNIADGATSTSTLNNSNFGTSMVKTFTIQNTGTTPLYINTPILFSGNNNTEFAMLGMPAASIAAAGSTTFSVAFTPTSTGTKSTTIRIENSDCDEAVYDFVITATTTPGAALHFDGNNDYVYCPLFSSQNNNVTFQAKVSWEGPMTTNQFILNNGNSGSNGYGLYVAANSNSVFLIYGGVNVFNLGYTLTPNVWTSLSGVIETNKFSLYANGVLTTSFSTANPAVPSGSFNIGSGVLVGFETFNGSIDEVLLWHRPLSACEILAYLNSEIPTTGTNLVANYHFNQGIAGGANSTSTVLTDFSGNNYSLTLVNFGLSNTTSNWIAPGGVVSGFTTVTFPGQEINVTGNAASILNKDYFTTVNDFSHFGNGTGVLTRTFVIQNTGTAALTIFSTTITGPQATEFSLTVAPPSTIAASSSGSFVVSFANNQPGIRSATVTILNNDCDEDNYQFAVSGGMTQLYTGRYNASRVAKARTDVTNACNNWMVVTGSSIGTAVDNYNGKVYYSGYGAGNIGVVNQDGSAINNSLLTGQGSVIGMTFDEINQKLFFAVDGPGGIRSVDANGTGLFAVATVSACYDVAVDPINQKVYYVAFGSNNIGVVNYDGSGHNPNFITGGSSPYGICTDMNAGKLYWASFGGSKIGTANLDGTGVNQNFVTGISGITDLVVDNTTGKLFFTNGNIGSVNINGTGLNTAFQPGIGATWGLALGGYVSPTLSLSASANSICPGSSVAITATTNATTYTWSTGPNTTSITVTPTINTTYSLTVTDAQSCTLQATQVITVVSSPEIDLIGNAISIPAGSSTPTLSNHTDFGNISNTGAVIRTFTIQNTGPANLTVSSITLSGVNANQFTVGALSPASPIPSGTFAVFSITAIPTSIGPKTATVTISNNDCNEAVYDFVVTATSTNAACFNFDGNNDYVATNVTLTASYTKEAWVKIGASTNGNNFIGGGTGSGGHTIWAPGLTGYLYKLSAGHDFTWNAVQDPTALNFNTWYHIAVSYDAPSTTMNLYKNGVLVASSNTIQPFTGSYPISLAAYGGSFSVNGSMDEVRIWNRALCQTEIVNNMNCEILTTANGLLANYHFNQGIASGSNATLTTVTDASGNNNNGTLANVALTGTVSNWIEPGAVVSGSACSSITIPEINLVGNGVTINDGDITPTTTDNTNFGAVCVGGTIVKTFTIQNTGTAPLTVGTISLGGTNANLFSVGALSPASPVSAGGSAVFSVTYTPLTAGVSSPTISFTNNDCNESPYDVVFTATANALPTVTASASSSVICAGFTTSLIGSGANTYTWSGSAANNTAFSPTVTTSYTVNGTNTLTGCTSTNSAVQTITVNALPTVTANATATVVCFGGTVTLSGSGANTYSWTGGVSNGVSFTPNSTTTYTLSGTSLAGCTNTNLAVQTITVNALPVVAVPGGSICSGQSFTLTPTGAFTYTYSNGPVVSPSITTSYSVTGTGTNGCVTGTAAVVTITVDTTPTVSVNSGTICFGQSFTIVPSGANSYTLQGSNTVVSPTITSTYTIIGSSAAGCISANTETSSVFVNSLPNVVIKATDTVICYGKSVTLSGSGANTYSWTSGVIDNASFSPTTTATYSVTGTNANGCENFASVTVTVNSLPSLTISSSNTLACAGETIQLSGSGANTYTWSSSETTSVITVTLAAVSDITLTGTDANGCANTSIFTQSVTPCSGTFAVVPIVSNVSCRDKNDGRIDVTPILTFTNNKVNYYWSPSTLCPGNDCAQLENLKAGTYSVTVKVIYTVTSTFVKNDSTSIAMTIKDENPPCNLIVYTGVTPNNDGVNDVWKIENIELYPNNHIQVFNRWGSKVMDIKGYNNNTKSWPTAEEFKSLTPSTYFYLIDLGDNSPPVKGWLEIMGN
jgi:gliding motility-associated-like protein